MIPKTLVYCNFGNMKLQEVELKCMKTWDKCFPKSEWNWVELNESNFDINKNEFTKKAYNDKRFNLVADYARTEYLYENGGIYVDTDLYMIKPLDNNFLNLNKAFFSIDVSSHIKNANYNNAYLISWGLVGANKNNIFIKEILNNLNNIDIKNNVDSHIVMFISRDIIRKNINYKNINSNINYESNDFIIYPYYYFTNDLFMTNRILNNNSYSVHLYATSWNRNKINNYINNMKLHNELVLLNNIYKE